jgi:hypothetical protein
LCCVLSTQLAVNVATFVSIVVSTDYSRFPWLPLSASKLAVPIDVCS